MTENVNEMKGNENVNAAKTKCTTELTKDVQLDMFNVQYIV